MITRIQTTAAARPGVIEITACGRHWRLHRPDNLEALWEAMTEEEFSDDERLPYWVELWPASIALGEWLLANRALLAGSVCLDLGCGLGFTALVASLAGARVVGMDYEREALTYARKNALVNDVSPPLWTVMDWRCPAVRPGSCRFIWGGDIMYERRFVAPVLGFLEHALAPTGRVWVAEPGRGVYQAFTAALLERGWSSRRVVRAEVDPLHVQKTPVPVNLWELSRPGTDPNRPERSGPL